jgi:hypothetical protein
MLTSLFAWIHIGNQAREWVYKRFVSQVLPPVPTVRPARHRRMMTIPKLHPPESGPPVNDVKYLLKPRLLGLLNCVVFFDQFI